GSDNKLIYRHYATLYFVFCVDSSESELGILDLIQVFVETLDKCFENVCELDLIFHVDKVHNILAEMVMGGMCDFFFSSFFKLHSCGHLRHACKYWLLQYFESVQDIS
ncbi:hypothetical protein M91_19264, partial [Bos mutus]